MAERTSTERLPGWAFTGITFAGTMLILIGVFQVIGGIATIAKDDIIAVGREYTLALDPTVWGWIRLTLGILIAATGFGLFAGASWAIATAIVLAVLSAIDNFLFLPQYPQWSILLIAFDVWVIWSLSRLHALRT